MLAGCLAALLLTACTTDRTRRAYLAENALHLTAPPANPVVVIPGFGVTRLRDPETSRHVWGTPRSVVRTVWADDVDLPFDPDTLVIGRDRLVPDGFAGSRGPVNTAFQLVRALEKYGGYREGVNLHPFAYDWRLSALENAVRLETFVAEIRRAHAGERVDVVAHSAGGLLAVTWLKLGGGEDDVRNLVLLAPPAAGTIEAFRMLVRPEQFIRRTFGPAIVGTWPSVPELFPEDGTIFVDEEGTQLALDLWSASTWRQLGIFDEGREALFIASLGRARAFRTRLRHAPLPAGASVHVIAGDCVGTARRVLLRNDSTYSFYPGELKPQEEHLRALLFEAGDGTVTRSSATSTPGRTQLLCDGHQGLATDPNAHRAVIRILRENFDHAPAGADDPQRQ
jgi:pimeloyl-ACP methyl ester carboxylesterase